MKQNGIPLNEIDLENSAITNIEETKISKNRGADITYGIDDVPPWYLCFFMALQHYLTMIGAIVSIPFILTPALCMAEDDPARSYIISTMIFVTGLVTLLQTTIGCRLPLVQGGTISFLVPTLAILSLPQWKCPAPEILEAMSHENRTELWQIRMRELSGAIAISALFQVIVGFGGIIGLMLKFITPLTIVPTVSLVGLSLFENAAEAASKHWGIAAGTILMLTMYSQILINVSVPIVMYRKGHGLRIVWFELFKLFPVLLTIVVMWIICTILTVTDTLPVGHPARSDSKIKIISDSPWFRIPYPGQWGVPTVSLSGVLGMLAGVLACTVESISYYPTTSRMCGAPPPPVHAINRGIGIEGLGTMLAGLWGSGNGTNTFGENVGTIGVTKVGSRRVIQWACGLMILQGLISKFGAVFIIIPEPIVGGIFCVMFGMICAFGLSALQYVNLNSSRNLYILGFSIFFPMVLSKWMIKHADVINTGNDIADGVITVLLSTTILVGGVIGCLLDNIIPGTDEERGLLAWSKEMELNVETSEEKQSEEYVPNTFDFPIGMKLLRRWKWTSYLPFSPTYKPNSGVYIATIRVQRYLNMPLVQRCSELAVLIDESSTTELQHVFPIIIDSLFGITDNIGWGLHNITYKKNPQEYEMLYNFLSPHGPIFSLCYKLLPDCYLKYNFPVSYLPSKIRSMLEEGVIPPFYLDKIRDDQGTRVPSALFMNPFEYYIFHFAYHLTNPWLQIQQQENVWVNWETVYVQSAHYYLHHFLPRDNSPVLPIIGPYIKKTPQRKLMQSPENKRLQTPRLLRASILSPGSTNLVVGVPQQQCLPQVWRSETVIQVFLDFWMEYTEDDHMPSQMNMSYSTPIPHRHSIHSGEHIRLVRAFIKTLHEFANSSIGDKSAMDELKRIILPSVQGKIYVFLRKAIYHWPLDSSFRLILEAWLSFIQPWRYIAGVTYTKEGKPEEEERGKIHDPNRWITFVANNLLAYTVIFQQLLPRFMRTDLVAPKNALMLFRVTKVFSQPHLARILSEVESCMDDANLNRNRMQSSQWTSVVRQQIMELEGPTYQYIPMFSTTTITQVTFFLSIIKQAHLTATSLIEALEKRKRSQQFLVALWEFFYGEENSSDDISIEERRRVPIFLANAQQQLIDMFQISLEDIPQISITPDQEYHDSILSTSFHHQSQVDSSLDSSRPGVFVPIPDGRQNFRYIEYMGDPELQPVRSNECAYLVRNLYNFCSYINNKYQYEINTLYNKRNFLGSICRQVLIPPTTIVKLPKRTINGFSSGSEELIPPRLSLRRLSSYGFLIFISASMFMAWITNYGILWLLCLMFFIWFLYILIRAIFEPWFQSSTNTFRPNTTAFSIN